MNRRNFILLTGTGAYSIASPNWFYNFYGTKDYQLLREPLLLSYIWDNNTISQIGEIYLEQFLNENNKQRLISLILNNISYNRNTITKLIQQEIISDYSTDNIIVIDGWVLSRIEARQCALFSLTLKK